MQRCGSRLCLSAGLALGVSALMRAVRVFVLYALGMTQRLPIRPKGVVQGEGVLWLENLLQ